jgi:hypothetical protein
VAGRSGRTTDAADTDRAGVRVLPAHGLRHSLTGAPAAGCAASGGTAAARHTVDAPVGPGAVLAQPPVHQAVQHRPVQHRLIATERNGPRAVRILDATALSYRRRGVHSTVGVGTPGRDTRAPGPGAEATRTDPRRTQGTQVRYVACAVEPATGEPVTGKPANRRATGRRPGNPGQVAPATAQT